MPMNYTSIQTIMDRILRHPLMKDIPLETVVDYAVDFIQIVGVPNMFIEKTADIKIDNYRGVLPCDFYEMIQVRPNKCNKRFNESHAFRYTTDSFHLSPHKNKCDRGDLTYKLQGNCIFTSIEEGSIEIAYRAIIQDEDGFPVIPDNRTFAKALELYVKKQWFEIQFELGKLNVNIINKIDQEYSWAVGQCSTDMIRPSIDELEAFSNMWNTLLPQMQHRYGFKDEGTQEHLKIH